YRVVFMQRPLDEIIASQSAMLQRTGKRSADAATLQRIYANQLREVEQWLAQQTAFAVLPMQYHRVINDAAAVAQEVSSFLRRALDRAAMIRAVDPQLYRQRAADKQG
ncbi:MAG TPA: hypothetical protein VG095_05730, partial [Chthoniobacterales bacterium]|nr:hypothetical protein [Chthoniobacterales bacterium]